jgi:hypothetical protein
VAPPTPKKPARRLAVESLEARCVLATVETVYEQNFEGGGGGFAADNTGGSVLGLWHYSLGRRSDGLPNHTPDHNYYYGAFETSTGGGRFDVLPFDHRGTLKSPDIQLPDCGPLNLSFSYLLDTRPQLDVDFGPHSVASRRNVVVVSAERHAAGNERCLACGDGRSLRVQRTENLPSFPL